MEPTHRSTALSPQALLAALALAAVAATLVMLWLSSSAGSLAERPRAALLNAEDCLALDPCAPHRVVRVGGDDGRGTTFVVNATSHCHRVPVSPSCSSATLSAGLALLADQAPVTSSPHVALEALELFDTQPPTTAFLLIPTPPPRSA